jgi:prepilin-type processing-associated H-X9-DG protein
MSYQWNVDLRTLAGGHRTSNKLKPTSPDPQNYAAYWQWIGGQVKPPNETTWYYTQAIAPEELAQPAMVMESSDGWDLRTAPKINWLADPGRGMLTPGISVGPYINNGRVLYNGFRHKAPPNVLYADGHVKADATKVVDALAELGSDFEGASIYTYPDWNDVWGNLEHVVPRLEKE